METKIESNRELVDKLRNSGKTTELIELLTMMEKTRDSIHSIVEIQNDQ